MKVERVAEIGATYGTNAMFRVMVAIRKRCAVKRIILYALFICLLVVGVSGMYGVSWAHTIDLGRVHNMFRHSSQILLDGRYVINDGYETRLVKFRFRYNRQTKDFYKLLEDAFSNQSITIANETSAVVMSADSFVLWDGDFASSLKRKEFYRDQLGPFYPFLFRNSFVVIGYNESSGADSQTVVFEKKSAGTNQPKKIIVSFDPDSHLPASIGLIFVQRREWIYLSQVELRDNDDKKIIY